MSGQVMLCFEGGLQHHLDVGNELTNRELVGVFAVPTARIGGIGFLSRTYTKAHADQLLNVWPGHTDHFVCNNSHEYRWMGQGSRRANLKKCTKEEITEDYIKAREELNAMGHHGDYLVVPFGTGNVEGPDHLRELRKEFKWIRMTVGAPLADEILPGTWTDQGMYRLYPKNYGGQVIGVSVVANADRPDDVIDTIGNAIKLEKLAVVEYHSVCDVVGEGKNITWKRFMGELDYIASMVGANNLNCVVPSQLV